jgi:hypothetical protein
MFQELDLPINPLVEDVQFPEFLFRDRRNRYYPIDKKNINEQTKKIFDDLDLTIGGVIIFKKCQNGISPIHSDILLVNDRWIKWHAAINYNLTSADSNMTWFETKLQEIYPTRRNLSQPLEYNLSGIHYGYQGNKYVSNTDFSLIGNCKLTAPTLIRTDIPHTTVNLDSRDRLCASIRFTDNHTYQELLEKFLRIGQ